MKSNSQLSVTHFKNALPYIFAKRAHRIMWAIGALVLFMTVPFLNSQFQTHADMSNKNALPAQPPKNTTSEPRKDTTNLQDTSSIVRINNQVIPLPSNGSVHKTIQSDDGQTKLNASIDSSSSSDQSHSSTNIQLNVHSQQETTIDNSE